MRWPQLHPANSEAQRKACTLVTKVEEIRRWCFKPRESLPIPVASSSRFGLQDCTSEFCITLQPSVVLAHHQLQKLPGGPETALTKRTFKKKKTVFTAAKHTV